MKKDFVYDSFNVFDYGTNQKYEDFLNSLSAAKERLLNKYPDAFDISIDISVYDGYGDSYPHLTLEFKRNKTEKEKQKEDAKNALNKLQRRQQYQKLKAEFEQEQ